MGGGGGGSSSKHASVQAVGILFLLLVLVHAVHVECRKCTDEPTEPGVVNTAYVANAVS